MRREPEEPTTDERGYERHPAWGLIGASRVQSSAPGAVLFDSDIRHMHTVVLRLHGAIRQRSLNRDWHGADQRASIVEVEMSEAQWASFVSSMNVGDGVPCTIRARAKYDGDYNVPEAPYDPRLAESMEEVRNAADKSLEAIREAFAAVEAKPTKANIRNLGIVLRNAPSNMTFAAKSLSEHAENVVQRARADVEAMVLSKAQQLGLDPGEVGVTMPQLESGGDEERS
jgi:hypothetical protein